MKKGYLYLIVGLNTNHQFQLGDVVECIDNNVTTTGCSIRSGMVTRENLGYGVYNHHWGGGGEADCYRCRTERDDWYVGVQDAVEIGKI